MKNKVILALLFVFLAVSHVLAQTALKAEVDKKELTADELLTYKLIVTTQEKKVSAPAVPKFEGFVVVSQAQSSTISFVKNSAKTILVYAFILAPKEAGKFTIEPSILKMKNSVISSESFEIEVKAGKLKPRPQPEEELPPAKPQIETGQPQVTL
jgi:hypothetical protein